MGMWFQTQNGKPIAGIPVDERPEDVTLYGVQTALMDAVNDHLRRHRNCNCESLQWWLRMLQGYEPAPYMWD